MSAISVATFGSRFVRKCVAAHPAATPLQAHREVGCLAGDPPPLRLSHSKQVADDHEPSGDANTGFRWSGRLQYTDRCDLLQPGPYR